MGLLLLRKGQYFSRKNKKWLLLFALFGASGYGAYRAYHLPSLARKRELVMKLLRAFVSLGEMASDFADTITVISKDLNEFLTADSDEIPKSLKQISKIVTSKEFSASLAKFSEALTLGISIGCIPQISDDHPSKIGAAPSNPADRVLNKLFSKAATGFVSAVVGSFARNLVLGFCSAGESVDNKLNTQAESKASDAPGWVSVICDERCGKLIGDCVQLFVSTVVAVFLDKTVDVNTYDEIFAGLTNPKHQDKVKGILISLCNGAVETFVTTSHQVLTNSSVKSNSSSSVSSVVIESQGPTATEERCQKPEAFLHQIKLESPVSGFQDAGWLEQIIQTMSAPVNRKFVADVTGRVTFETVRSFVAFLLWRTSEDLKRSLSKVRDEVVAQRLEVVRYVGAKSSVILTLCLALYLHIMGGRSFLLPA